MSKVGAWVLNMQEDAYNMTRKEFIKKHGEGCVDVWDNIHNGINQNKHDEPDKPLDIS